MRVLNFAQRQIFSDFRYYNEPENIRTHSLKSLPEGLVLTTFMSPPKKRNFLVMNLWYLYQDEISSGKDV
jgi:hypothetical protein